MPRVHTSDEIAALVDEIYEIMREGRWTTGYATEFAALYDVSSASVRQYQAEAWRRVCFEADNPEKMRPEIAGYLHTNLVKAHNQNAFSSVAKLADTWSKVIGARAPERHEHQIVIAQFDSLTDQGKIAWIEERIKKLEEAKAALLEVVIDVPRLDK